MSRKSPSKINVFLKVTARRPDGYHELESLFLPLVFPCDTVSMQHLPQKGLRVVADIPGLPEDEDNLAGKAAAAYAARAGITPAWRFAIEKRIPIAAGMGGGSSDAACVLRLLNDHYGALTPAALAQLALTLGADVPFFLEAVPAIATGVGECLTPVPPPAPGASIVLIEPGFPVSARWAYTHLAPSRIGADSRGDCRALAAALHRGEWAHAATLIHNDLGFALFDKFPLLGMLRDFCRRNGALCCEVTGSGPVLFAWMPDREQAQVLIALAAAEFPHIPFRLAVPADKEIV